MHKVLVAEDDPAIRLLYRLWLESDGYDVRIASDGREAIMLLELERLPDAAVLDVDMPYVDGLSVCRYLRMRGVDLPIVVVSGLEDVADTARLAGATRVLAKPCDRDELLGALVSTWAREDARGRPRRSRPTRPSTGATVSRHVAR
jgi:two-component system, OmpR family, response regulator MprA